MQILVEVQIGKMETDLDALIIVTKIEIYFNLASTTKLASMV